MDSLLPGGFCGFRNRIASPALLAIADHWQQARAGRPMPAWSDLSPCAIGSELKRLWAFKYHRASGEFTARLAGNRAMLRFGKSFRGTPLKELHPAPVYEQARSHMVRIVSQPALVRCTGRLFRIGERTVEGERIALPLASDGHEGDGILGASDFTPLGVPGPIELLYERLEWFSARPAKRMTRRFEADGSPGRLTCTVEQGTTGAAVLAQRRRIVICDFHPSRLILSSLLANADIVIS